MVGAVGDREAIREVALRHNVCPYYLTQGLVRWSDVVIADYNYQFDTTAALHLLTLANEWKVGVRGGPIRLNTELGLISGTLPV